MKTTFAILPALALSGAALLGRAQETDWTPYDLGSTTTGLTVPDGATLNSFVPDKNGGYVALWDDAEGPYLERRNPDGVQRWWWQPPLPKPPGEEVSRALITSRTHVLWCSAQRWFYLSLEDGSVTRSNEWSLPYLDAIKLVPQGDLLYVVYGGGEGGEVASVYDTNMVRLVGSGPNWDPERGVVKLNWPAGFWRPYAGAWMVDLNSRTTRTLRVATLGEELQATAVYEFPLSHSRSGGYLEHRVLGANAGALFVVSSLHWPDHTTHYFTHVTAAGRVTFQHRLEAHQLITGAAVLPNGWLISAQWLRPDEAYHTLYRVDQYGRPLWQVRAPDNAEESHVLQNTNPPWVLRFQGSQPWELRRTKESTWLDVLGRVFSELPYYSLAWDGNATDISSLIGNTEYFWLEPTWLNNL